MIVAMNPASDETADVADETADQTADETADVVANGTRRRVALLVVVALVLTVVGVSAALVSSDDDDGVRPVDEAGGLRAALRACQAVDELVELVQASARSDHVIDKADDAVDLALGAYEQDPTWLPLASGTQALRAGLTRDSAAGARAGIDVTRSECRRARAAEGGTRTSPEGTPPGSS